MREIERGVLNGAPRQPGAVATGQTFAFRALYLGPLHLGLWLHTARDPSSAEWTASCKAFRQLRESCGVTTRNLRALIISDGGAPSTQQRAELFSELQLAQHLAALITRVLDNPLERGIVTALTWTNRNFRAFDPERWREAFQHVGLDDRVAQVWSELAELQRQLPPNDTFARVVRAAGLDALRTASHGSGARLATSAATRARPPEP